MLATLKYFELCKVVGMYVGWSFLFGLLPAFPASLLAVRTEARHPFQGAVWTLLAFTIYFWSCQGLFLWQAYFAR